MTFPMLFALIALFLGVVFLSVSTKAVWDVLDRLSVEANPIRRFVRSRWPRFDAGSSVASRWLLRIIGFVAVIFGLLVLLGELVAGQ